MPNLISAPLDCIKPRAMSCCVLILKPIWELVIGVPELFLILIGISPLYPGSCENRLDVERINVIDAAIKRINILEIEFLRCMFPPFFLIIKLLGDITLKKF